MNNKQKKDFIESKIKEFDEIAPEIMVLCFPSDINPTPENKKKEIKHFLTSSLNEAWEKGEREGFLKYPSIKEGKAQTLKQIGEWAEKNEVKKGEGVMGKDSDLINEEYAHNDVLEDLKKFINTL